MTCCSASARSASASRKFVGFLTAPGTGVGSVVSTLANDSGIPLAPLPPEHIVNQNVTVALAEKSQSVKYPVVYVYSDRVRNLLTEKFRRFSVKEVVAGS